MLTGQQLHLPAVGAIISPSRTDTKSIISPSRTDTNSIISPAPKVSPKMLKNTQMTTTNPNTKP